MYIRVTLCVIVSCSDREAVVVQQELVQQEGARAVAGAHRRAIPPADPGVGQQRAHLQGAEHVLLQPQVHLADAEVRRRSGVSVSRAASGGRVSV